jgi:hypothetical protein
MGQPLNTDIQTALADPLRASLIAHSNCRDDIKAKCGENSNAWRVRVLGEFLTADDETVTPLSWCSRRWVAASRPWSTTPCGA